MSDFADATTISPAWARDACECSECRDPHNDQHLINASDLVGWTTESTATTDTGLVVTLRHDDGRTHECTISAPTDRPIGVTKSLWGAELTNSVRPGAASAEDFATRLATFGIAIIEHGSTEPNTVLDFAGEIGFVRETNYGELFDVIAEESPNNLAFTNLGLPLHTDNPYRDPVPTVQLLHCLHSAETGGGSMFADGFAVAEKLREHNEQAFDILTNTPVQFEFSDDTVLLAARTPLISLDSAGDVVRVAVNNRSMRPVDAGEHTGAFYDAYVEFTEMLAHDDNTLVLNLGPGEIIGFDNRRVLHGRTGFAGGGARHLQGCYIDIDAINSKALLGASG